ncbi:MAG: hypothetical protein L6Q37_04835, partial [Bdellovibrionaceae bacterium]|nr:hypothetical protein [Pseudobdellovibrionaceae bacterium]
MNRRAFLMTMSTFSLVLISGCVPSKKQGNRNNESQVSKNEHAHDSGYWTCTMHPQVHKKEAGKCPICGMPLVLVDKKVHVETTEENKNETGGVQPTNTQIKNANISKYTVSKKDFVATIAFSGRLTSAKDVSLQIYETDRALIKMNMIISGYS